MTAAMASTVRRNKLGQQGLEVSAQGLGCMGMSAYYGAPKSNPDMIALLHHAIGPDMIALLHHAIGSGVTFLDTSDIYGPYTNEILLGKSIPRFRPENVAHNAKLFDQVNEITQRKGCTPSQLALAWVHHQGDDICPIPSATKIENFNQNIGALSVKLTPEEMAELESIAFADNVKGGRYASSMPTWENSDSPPLSSRKAA